MKARRTCGRWLGLFLAALLWVLPSLAAAQALCGSLQTELIAGRRIAAGIVDISHDDTALYVTLSTEGWAILRSQVHVAATPDGIPQTRWGHIPRVRRFDYAHVHESPVVTDTFSIALEELGLSAGGGECIDQTLAVAVHALLAPTSRGRRFPRSAWAAGTSFSRWGRPMYVEYDLRCCAVGGPIIAVDPESHDFGAPFIGCGAEQAYTISNLGNAELVVHDIQFATGSADLSLDLNEAANGALPWTVSPGLGLDVFVDYTPLDEFDDTAFLTVLSNDPLQPEVVVTANGDGTFYGEQLDVYEQAVKGAVDILFTLDRSGSMSDDNALVVANFGTFINTLSSLNVDYHIAVAVEDDGCILGSDAYIDNTFSPSDAESTFETHGRHLPHSRHLRRQHGAGLQPGRGSPQSGKHRFGRLQRGPVPRGRQRWRSCTSPTSPSRASTPTPTT